MISNNKKQSATSFYVSMPSFKKIGLMIFSVVTLAMPVHANEQDTGFYAGFGIANIAAEEMGQSSRENGLSLIGGYSFSKYFSAETSLFNLGDHQDLGMKGNGASLSIIGSYPVIENFSVFGELGGMSVDLEIDESKNLSYSGTDTETMQDGRDSSIYYAFGAKYKLNDWTLVFKNSLVDLDADMDIFSLQAHYNF